MSRLPALKVIGKYGVGLDVGPVGTESLWSQTRLVSGVNRRSVAELVVSFAISFGIELFLNRGQSGKWYG